MTSRTTSALGRKPINRGARAIGYVLLLVVIYGATVEIVHSHGPELRDQSGLAAISDAGQSHSSDTGHSHYTECQICQFHQHLFNGLVQAPLFARTPLVEIAFVSTPIVLYPFNSITPSSGRGPPLG